MLAILSGLHEFLRSQKRITRTCSCSPLARAGAALADAFTSSYEV